MLNSTFDDHAGAAAREGAAEALDTRRGARRFDPFRRLSRAERLRRRKAYLEHLRRRDGEIDYEAGCLPRRDRRQRELESDPITWPGELDRDAFYQHFHRVGEPETDLRTLWAVAIALANEGERFGAIREVRRFEKQGLRNVDPVMLYHVLQENVHTDRLLETCRTVGLAGVRLKEPKIMHRWIIRAMAYFPDSLRYMMILCGEMVGCVTLQLLHDTAGHFAESPEIRARLESILAEIVYDETLHVLHCQSRVGWLGVTFARVMLPMTAWMVLRDVPQFASLGCDRAKLLALLRAGLEIPEDCPWILPGEAGPAIA